MKANDIVVRIPPSPTGLCHVGTARMALLNFAFARHTGGKIVFRSEDTDSQRSKPEYEQDIIQSFSWLGISWDEFLRQSERTDIYAEHIRRLLAEDKAYISKEPSKKDAMIEVEVVRLRNVGHIITFHDIIRGDITFDTTELGDFVIARSINDPLYHLTVVIDDALCGVTHIIRGEDHISNTPRQILIQEAFGFVRPQYAHYPLNLGTDRSKLSKRNADVSVSSYRAQGYLPKAMVNYLAMIGWTHPENKEIFNIEDYIKYFDIADIHKSAAIFDVNKLRWINREYLLQMSEDEFDTIATCELANGIVSRGIQMNQSIASKIVPLIRERISLLADLRVAMAEGEYDFFFADPNIDVAKLVQSKSTPEATLQHLHELIKLFSADDTKFADVQKIKDMVMPYADASGRGAVLWPFRFALSGRDKSPDPFTIAFVVERQSVIRRLRKAVDLLVSNKAI